MEPVDEGGLVDQIRNSVPLAWIIAMVGFFIGGFLGQAIAGPAATVPAALLSGLIAGAFIGLGQGIALGLRGRALGMWTGGTAIALAHRARGRHRGDRPDRDHDRGDRHWASSPARWSVRCRRAFLTRAGIANAWLWIPVTAVAWAIGWLVTASIGVALAPGWPVYGASGAVVSQVITGHRGVAARPVA